MIFSGCSEPYATREAFEKDVGLHQVKRGTSVYSKYAGEPEGPWPGPLGPVYAWHVSSVHHGPPEWIELYNRSKPAIRRRLKPFFDVEAPAPPLMKPRIAVFSGPNSTVANTAPLITSNKARELRGLPLRRDAYGEPLRMDALRLQRLAAPVEVLIAQFSEHPLAADAAELHGPPDGWCDPATGEFHEGGPQHPGCVPCYKVTLRPEDGPYALPFMGVTRSGDAWDGPCSNEGDRQTFFPDASGMYTEIDRTGYNTDGDPSLLSSQASYDFYRAAPPAGYTKGQDADRRTDAASVSTPCAGSDLAPEVAGRDFYRYYPYHLQTLPTEDALLRATNLVQSVMGQGAQSAGEQYAGCQWLEASCAIEETLYWLSLLIDTKKPIVGHSAQRPHGTIGSDGGINIVNGVKYITSGIWDTNTLPMPILQPPTAAPESAADAGCDVVGAVLVVDDQAFSAREVAKTDARPGNYAAVGGHGGIVAGLHLKPTLTFIPTRKATWRSEVNISRLPPTVRGVAPDGGGSTLDVRVLDEQRALQVLPRVGIVKTGHYTATAPREELLAPFSGSRGVHGAPYEVLPGETAQLAVGVLADLTAAQREAPLHGFVAEGANPYAYVDDHAVDAALLKAVFSGAPVCRVARGNTGGFCYPSGPFFIAGSNLTSTKARVLLQAALLKLGMLPPAIDPERPTVAERDAIAVHVRAFQEIFDTH